MHLENRTPFEASAVPLVAHDDMHTLVVAVKGTFSIGSSGRPVLADDPVPVYLADVYHGDPGTSSLRYEADIATSKPGTDVALIGTAYAPAGPVRQLDVGLKIGPLAKILRVYGDRQWRRSGRGWGLTDPQPFETMPLLYENAYGGADPLDPSRGYCEANPVGKGFAADDVLDGLDALPAPNIEHRDTPIAALSERPPPAGFGFIARHWAPRRALAGTYDDAWQRDRCPLLPTDFDPRCHAAASEGLRADAFLGGGEPVVVVNATPAGRLEFALPTHALGITASVAGERVEQPMRLDTVVIEPDEARVALTWRAALPCHWNLSMVEWIRVDERR